MAAAWTDVQTAEALTAEVDRITAQLESGTPFADVAAGIGQFPVLSPEMKRDGSATVAGLTQADPVLTAGVAREIFNGGPTHFGSALNADGDHVIFQVVEVNAAEDANTQAADFVENSYREGLYQDILSGLIAENGIRTNQQVLNQLTSSGATQ